MANLETRGRKKYDAKIKNLEGIFNKLDNILDISEYIERFKNIKLEVEKNVDFSKEMISLEMRLDYEDNSLLPYNRDLDTLSEDIEKDLLPFYELHLLTSKIDIQISEISLSNILDIIQNTKNLIDLVNSLSTHNNKEKNKLIQKAYNTIYSVILYEEIFNKSDILTYVNYLNISANRENIGRILAVDLKNLSEKDLIEEGLKNIKTEGLGYDYLNEEIIRKVSRKTVGEINSEYQERKKQAILDLTLKVNDFKDRKQNLINDYTNNKKSLNALYLKKSILISKVLSLVLIPVITFNVGKSLGKKLSNNITEYKTITRTVNLNTGKIIGDSKEVWDEKSTTYVATIMEYSPWRQNTTGTGYISNVIAYEYIISENTEDDYHLTLEDVNKIDKNEKYRYVEHKDKLDFEDSTTDYTINITETFQDKLQNRKSTKFIIPFSILGIGIGLFTDTLLIFIRKFGIERTKYIFSKLNEEIKENKLNNKQIRKMLEDMKNNLSELQDEYNEVVKLYGNFGDQLIIPEIDSGWIPKIKKTK